MTNLTKVQIAQIESLGLTVEIFESLTAEQQTEILVKDFQVKEISTKKSKSNNNIQSVIDQYVQNSGKTEFTRTELLQVIMTDNFSSFFYILNNGKVIKEVKNFQELSLYFTLGCELKTVADNKQVTAAVDHANRVIIVKKQWQARANNILNEVCNVNHAKYYNIKDSGLKYTIKDIATKMQNFTFELIVPVKK